MMVIEARKMTALDDVKAKKVRYPGSTSMLAGAPDRQRKKRKSKTGEVERMDGVVSFNEPV